MSASYYWQRFSQRRISRRRVLKAATAVGFVVAGSHLVACGGGGEEGGATPQATQGPAETPQPGGILKSVNASDVATFDPIRTKDFTTSVLAGYVYNRLVKFKTGFGELADGSVIGDVIESWEQPDDLTLLMHLRKGMKLDERPPTSGRAIDSEDVLQSWQAFASDSPYRSELVNSVSKDAAIVSVEALDAQTVQIKTAFPDAQLLPTLGHAYYVWVLPKEAFNGGYDPAKDIRGAGPWILDSHQPAVGFTLKKNPNYYGAPQYPLADGVSGPIILDTAQVEAQFKAKNIHSLTASSIPAPDMITIQKETGDTYISLAGPSCEATSIGVSGRPDSPFRDVRMRQAMSMLIDRDTMLDVFLDLKSFQDAGYDMRGYWSSPLAAGYRDFWLDPKSNDFGSSAKNYQFSVSEAKALLAAAGHGDGLEIQFTFLAGPQYGRDQSQRAEALMAMFADGGVKCKANPVDYVTVWVPQYLRAFGDFDGAAMYATGSRADPGHWFTAFLSSTGANNVVGNNYPELDTLIAQQRREFNREARIKLIQDIQRYCAENMPSIPEGGQVDGPSLTWNGVHGISDVHPWPGNPWSLGAEAVPYIWLDERLRS
jgi:peptide/nickel transport system substrate-binding protein